MNGTITKYDLQQGRGELTLENGQVIKFTWSEIETPPAPWPSNGRHGSGYVPPIGAAVTYEQSQRHQRPIRIVV